MTFWNAHVSDMSVQHTAPVRRTGAVCKVQLAYFSQAGIPALRDFATTTGLVFELSVV
jgi:hypothetical protein